MVIGLGGKIVVIYRRGKLSTLAAALFTGLVTVFLAAATSTIFRLEPIYFVVLVLVYAFVAGRVIGIFWSKRIRMTTPPPLPQVSEEEVREVVRRRGFGELLNEKKRKRRSRKR